MRKILAAIMLMTTFTVWAGDYEDGLAAFERKDYATAVEKFTTAAEQGNTEALNNIGFMYNKGLGVTLDYAESARWYSLAAEQGNARAQFNLGLMYENGQGVVQNYVEALRWYMIAAEQGNLSAAINRNLVSTHTTAQQIAEVKKLVTECRNRNYKGCN